VREYPGAVTWREAFLSCFWCRSLELNEDKKLESGTDTKTKDLRVGIDRLVRRKKRKDGKEEKSCFQVCKARRDKKNVGKKN
jgi:hypothetical protein